MSRNEVTTDTPPVPPRRKKRKSDSHLHQDPSSTQDPNSRPRRTRKLQPPPPPPTVSRTHIENKAHLTKNYYFSPPVTSAETKPEHTNVSTMPAVQQTTQQVLQTTEERVQQITQSEIQRTTEQENQQKENESTVHGSPPYRISKPPSYPPLIFTFQDFQEVMAEAMPSVKEDVISELFTCHEPKKRENHLPSEDSHDDNNDDDVFFRVITTNVPFEKCLGSWNGSFDGTEFSPDSHIFDDYIDRSKRVNRRPELFAAEELEGSSSARSAPRVKFIIESPSMSSIGADETIDSLGNIDSLDSDALIPSIELSDINVVLDASPSHSEMSANSDVAESYKTLLVKACIEACPSALESPTEVRNSGISESTGSCETVGKVEVDRTEESHANENKVETGSESLDRSEGKKEVQVESRASIPVNVRRNLFLEKMLTVDEEEVVSTCHVVATHLKTNPPEKKVELSPCTARDASQVKSDVLNELLSNFSAIKLRSVRPVEADGAVVGEKTEAGGDIKCAIVRDNDNNAMTPIEISNDQPQRKVPQIVPGSVRNFIKYYESEDSAGQKFSPRDKKMEGSARATNYRVTRKAEEEDSKDSAPKQSCIKRKAPTPKPEFKKSVQFDSGCTVIQLCNDSGKNNNPVTSMISGIRDTVTKRKAPSTPADQAASQVYQSHSSLLRLQATSGAHVMDESMKSGISCLIPKSDPPKCSKAYVFYCTV